MSDFLERINQLSPKRLALLAVELQGKIEALERAQNEPIAIVGLSCRFPGADDAAAFWRLLHDGVDAISEVDPSRWNVDELYDPDPDAPGKIATRWGGFISNVDRFDPQFFGISPREAISMDPQQRLLLEAAWAALENTGYAPDQLNGSATGVFVGVCNGDYYQMQLVDDLKRADMYLATGSAHSVTAGRISYVLGLQGPSLAIDTACSSSLVAVHEACQSLRHGECRMALAGGVNLILAPGTTIVLSRAKMMAPDGRCKAFDAAADGFVRSEGCGLVVLKRLSDAQADGDHILAIIRGTAVNQDGRSNGLTAPNGPSQVAVIRQALANANVQPHEIGYVETHGTGTSLGDPIEVQALGAALGAGRSATVPLMIGSVKTNLGHAESAAGIAGLVKTVLAMQHHEIPPHLHLQQLNPHIAWAELPITIPTRCTPWPLINGRRLAGVSSFGFGGTNAHIIIEEAPAPSELALEDKRPLHLVTLSAKSEAALQSLAARYEHDLADGSLTLGEVAHTANVGRAHLAQRAAIIAPDRDRLREKLRAIASGQRSDDVIAGVVKGQRPPGIVFLFTGQGSQYVGMGRELYETEPVFRATLDRCDEILRPYLGQSLLSILYPTGDQPLTAIDQTAVTQPILFAVEYALAELWKSWGVQPAVVMGHSVGEYVAACVAGVFSLEDGLKLMAERGRLMQSLPPTGEMAAVFAGEARVAEIIRPYADRVSIAAINWPDSVVISGEKHAVQAVLETLRASGIRSRALAISVAGHSPLMEPIMAEFERVAASVHYAEPHLDLVSGMTGEIAGSEVTSAVYWRRHLREPVRFADSITRLHQQGYELFVEIGPAPSLIGMAQRAVPEGAGVWLPSLRPGTPDYRQMLTTLATLYTRGVAVDWAGFDRDYAYQRVPLPTYPFERQRYWFDQNTAGVGRPNPIGLGGPTGLDRRAPPLIGQRVTSPVIREVVFETRLNAHWPAFLDHHRIFGLVVLPSPAYIELASSSAAKAFNVPAVAIEDFTIHEALVLPEDGTRVIQLVLHPAQNDVAAFEVFSRDERSDVWTQHAKGMVNLKNTDVVPTSLPLEEVRARCTEEISGEAYYDRVRDLGLEFGANFRGITQLWRRDGEALGLIQLPDDLLAEANAYRFHPALLDACFHVLGAPLPPSAEPSTYLLIGLDRFVQYRAPTARLWNHTTLRGAVGETFTGDIQLFDDEGRLVAEAQGLHLKRATRAALHRALHKSSRDEWLYEVQWQPRELSVSMSVAHGDVQSIVQIAVRVQPSLAALSKQYGLSVYHDLRPELDALTSAYVIAALRQLGWEPGTGLAADALAAQLGIAKQHRRLFERLLSMSRERQAVPEVDPQTLQAQLTARYPQAAAELGVLQHCGPQLAGVLRGEVDPLHLLFPAGSLALTEQLYRTAPFAQAYNTLAQQVIAAAQRDRMTPIRVLEIGAGSGATTAALLSSLPPDRTEYVFTDVSPLFLQSAAEKFRDRPFVRYELLDIEREPGGQGFAAQSFDVIVAANVLHATRDLHETLRHVKQLLAPRGLLILLEGTEPQHWVDVTFGLTAGWWRFSDLELRPDYPLLSATKWIDLLTSSGFEAATALALPQSINEVMGQAMIIASAPAPASGRWLICGDGVRLAEALLARGENAEVIRADEESEPLLQTNDYRGVIVLADDGTAEGLCGAALRKTQALLHSRASTKLWLITRGAQATGDTALPLNINHAAVWGLGRVIAVEHPEVWGGLIDLAPDDEAFDGVLVELLNLDSEDQVAWRGTERFVPRLLRTSLPATGEWRASPDDAYLITGGLGGLGVKAAEWLAQHGARQLVLIGRTGLTGDDADRKITAVKAIEALGATVTVVVADVADRAAMQLVFDRFGRDWPALRGVIHAAAAWNSAPLETLSDAALRDMLRPKVEGAWLLHEFTSEMSLDFFVMFSSTTGLWGARQLAHYAAANAYLDALAHYRRGLGLPALSIDWGTWAEMRTASQTDQQSYAQFGLQPMANEQALSVLGELLNQRDITQITVASVEWRALKAAYEAKRPRPFLAMVDTPTIEQSVGPKPLERGAEARPNWRARLAQTPAHERRELVAGAVRTAAAQVLRLDTTRPLDDQQGLFEMGMDSLMSVELKTKLEAVVGHALPSTLTFNYPSVAALTDYLLNDLTLGQDTPIEPVKTAAPAVESEQDDLSEDELAEMLAAKLSQLR
jgi:acyl transferase domain-containing protein/acyl carrier protein